MSGHRSGPLTHAANLALDEAVVRRRAAGEPILHLGFGEAGLPVHPLLVEALQRGVTANAYGPVAGREAPRAAVAGYFSRRRLPTEPDQIVLAPGSKPLLAAVIAAVEGDVLLAAPSWVTYAPQAALFGRTAHHLPIPAACGGVPDPDALAEALRGIRAAGRRAGVLILTSPDNPTGTTAPAALIRELCAVVAEHDVLVVSDEIYRDVVFDGGTDYVSPAELLPERTVVATGLSKSLALGGWRIGAARFPATEAGRALRASVIGVASNVWSNLAGPMQSVTETAFSEPAELVTHRQRSTRLHGIVARAVHDVFARHDLATRPPTGGFYVYPDLERLRARLAARGVEDAADLERYLLDELFVAVMGGQHFGDDPRALRFRAATSLLYGDTEPERWAALQADDPLAVPHVAAAIAQLDSVIGQLAD
jgi:aspartate aminotransferase